MIKHPLHQNSTEENIQNFDLTSMVDILFIIIIFFLLTIGTNIRTLDVALPDSKEEIKLTESGNNIVLQVSEDGYFIEDNKNLSLQELEAILPNYLSSNQSLLIASDRNAKAQMLLELLAFLKNNDIKVANILFDKKQ